jgi:hypothetical protein
LLIGYPLSGFWWECNLVSEKGRDFLKQHHTRCRRQLIPSQQRLERYAGLGRRNTLSQARGQMRVITEGIEFAGQELFEVWFFDFGRAHDDSVGGKIAQALASAARQTCDPTNQIKQWQCVNETQQIPNSDLAELEPKALNVRNPQAKQAFAQSLPSPIPLGYNAVSDLGEEKGQDHECPDQVNVDEAQPNHHYSDNSYNQGNARHVNEPS